MVDALKAPSVVAPDPAQMKLPELTRAIKDRVAQITSSLRTSVACAIETGALLIAAKKKVGHGNFERWVANNCELSPATARRWMELAEKRPELEKQLSAISGILNFFSDTLAVVVSIYLFAFLGSIYVLGKLHDAARQCPPCGIILKLSRLPDCDCRAGRKAQDLIDPILAAI
jgi:Protein of unknown function (DUF3102)